MGGRTQEMEKPEVQAEAVLGHPVLKAPAAAPKAAAVKAKPKAIPFTIGTYTFPNTVK